MTQEDKRETHNPDIEKEDTMAKTMDTMKTTRKTAIAPMHVDVVFPHGNETHLIDMAERLGITHVIFCYTLKDPLLKSRAKEIEKLDDPTRHITTEFAILVSNQQDVSRAKSMTKTVIGTARPELFEDKRVTHIIDMESGRRDDFIHHRNSGLNQVFIANAIMGDKTLLVDAKQLLFGDQPRAVVLGRMRQNNAFYRKYAPRVIVVSGASEPLEMRPWRDLQNLLKV